MGCECEGVELVQMVISANPQNPQFPHLLHCGNHHILYDILYDLKASNSMRLNLYYNYTIRWLRCYNKRKVLSLPLIFASLRITFLLLAFFHYFPNSLYIVGHAPYLEEQDNAKDCTHNGEDCFDRTIHSALLF